MNKHHITLNPHTPTHHITTAAQLAARRGHPITLTHDTLTLHPHTLAHTTERTPMNNPRLPKTFTDIHNQLAILNHIHHTPNPTAATATHALNWPHNKAHRIINTLADAQLIQKNPPQEPHGQRTLKLAPHAEHALRQLRNAIPDID